MNDHAFRELFRGKFILPGHRDTWHDPIDIPEMGPLLASMPADGWYVRYFDGYQWHWQGEPPSRGYAGLQAIFVVPGYGTHWLPTSLRFTKDTIGIFRHPLSRLHAYVLLCSQNG